MPPHTRKPDETIKQRVYRTLRASIMCGDVEPGRAITIHGVAADLGVGAMPVREALHRLVADGALEYLDNRRVRVPRMTSVKFDEIIAARVALETLAAERALSGIDAERLDLLEEIDQEIDSAHIRNDIPRATERNFAFHRAIYEAGNNAVILALLETVWLRLGPFMRLATSNLSESYRIDRHAEALAAIKVGSAAALTAAIEADIRDGLGHLYEFLRARGPVETDTDWPAGQRPSPDIIDAT